MNIPLLGISISKTKKENPKSKMATRIGRLVKLRIMTGAERNTVLPRGAVECVFGDGSGLNFFSIDDLNTFCATQPTSEDDAVKRSILLAAQEVDPTFVAIDSVKNIDLSVENVARPVVVTP